MEIALMSLNLSGHYQTIYPHFFRKVPPIPSSNAPFILSDGDEISLSYDDKERKSLVVLLHGLEGSSQSPYMQAMRQHLLQHDFDVLAINYRCCGGKENLKNHCYHAGQTSDVLEVVQHFNRLRSYENTFLLGFSFGGNMALKTLSSHKSELPANLKACLAISAPVDLRSAALSMQKGANRIYEKRFLQSLLAKVKQKQQKFPDEVAQFDTNKVHTLYAFDDLWTAPMHGFKSADDYYHQCSALYSLAEIDRPFCILNAQNDPIIGKGSIQIRHFFRKNAISFPPYMRLITPKNGGHCGFQFRRNGKKSAYHQDLAVAFFKTKGA